MPSQSLFRMSAGKPLFLQATEDYFHFSKSQRRAMLVMVLAGCGFGAILYWQGKKQWPRAAAMGPEQQWLAQLSVKDSLFAATGKNGDAHYAFSGATYQRTSLAANTPAAATLFTFDPNTVSKENLMALGLREGVAQAIVNYRSKGGRFYKPEDLRKIYVLKPEDANRLIPYVALSEPEPLAPIAQAESVSEMQPRAEKPPPVSKIAAITALDINRADSISWMALPGIGAKRAGAIMQYRQKLGGFIQPAQVAETFGLPDSVYRQIAPYLAAPNPPLAQLSINSAPEAELKAHPYIGWQMARIIVAYRRQHGAFASVDDLLKIYVVKKEWLDKVKPYLKTD